MSINSYDQIYFSFLIIISLSVALTSCSDSSLPVSNGQEFNDKAYNIVNNGGGYVPSQNPVVQWAEKPFNELSAQIPSFAGYFLDRNRSGNVIVLIKDLGSPELIRQKVTPYLNHRYHNSKISFSSSDIIVNNADFSFKELKKYRDDIWTSMATTEGVTSLDLSESINRITVGVESENYIGTVESITKELGVPIEAIKINVEGTVELSKNAKDNNFSSFLTHKTVNDKFRPLIGGIALNTCTFGFVAKWGSEDVFITNSHCTEITAGLDNNPAKFFQPDFNYQVSDTNLVGWEIYDISEPRNSDAAVIKFAGDESGNFGEVAKTIGRTWEWQVNGYKEIDDNLPVLTIVRDDRVPLVDMPVYKVGKRSGATGGYIDITCKDIFNWEGNKTLYCQYIADPLYNGSGDSGGPVASDFFSEIETGETELLGILWGIYDPDGPNPRGIFSPVSGVKQDLEDAQHALKTFDPPVEVTISGPSFIENTGLYTWDADISNSEGSVSYQWSIQWEGSSTWNSLGTNSSQSVNVDDGTDFTLKVEVSDIESSDSDIHGVTVELDCSPTNPCGGG